MEKLLTALQVSQSEYNNIVFQQYFNWCGTNSFGNRELQSLTANSALFAWWREQYTKYELAFMEEIRPYMATTKKADAYLLYIKNVHKIQLYYSKPLIIKAKNQNLWVNHN